MIKIGDRVLLAGQTGKGKSTLAGYLVERLQPIRTIVVDVKGELQLGATPVRSLPELEEALRRDPLIHYIPHTLDRDTMEEASMIIWALPGPWLLWIDEAAGVSSASYVPEGFKLAVTQGRQPRKMVIACTQRLAECHPVFRSQAEHRIVMVPSPIELDLRTVAGHLGYDARELKGMLDELERTHGPYSHLWHGPDGLKLCAPLPAEAISGPPATAPQTAAVDNPSTTSTTRRLEEQ